jgi:hypothetical protein
MSRMQKKMANIERQEQLLVDRRGQPKGVIMGFEDFTKTIAPEPEVLKAIRAYARSNRTNKLSMRAIDREIVAVRKERAENSNS